MFDLFQAELPVNDAPLDKTEINQVLLYYSNEELLELKRLVKIGMVQSGQVKGNISDFILFTLKQAHGKDNL